MGCFDTVLAPCPKCGVFSEFQSKGGACLLRTYNLEDAPGDVLSDVNRHAPNTCGGCGTKYAVSVRLVQTPIYEAKSIVYGTESKEDEDE